MPIYASGSALRASFVSRSNTSNLQQAINMIASGISAFSFLLICRMPRTSSVRLLGFERGSIPGAHSFLLILPWYTLLDASWC